MHRDIKPENILIARTPEGLVAKISDFGLAKSFRGLGLSGLTFSGEMRGTVPFMPPEQMLDFKTVTPAGDLYATAATLYYLLTCQFIYDQSRRGRRPDPDACWRSRRCRSRSVGRTCPPAWPVLEKCLARDPKDRYPTAAAMRKLCGCSAERRDAGWWTRGMAGASHRAPAGSVDGKRTRASISDFILMLVLAATQPNRGRCPVPPVPKASKLPASIRNAGLFPGPPKRPSWKRGASAENKYPV